MDHLVAYNEIAQAIYRLAYAQDDLDFADLDSFTIPDQTLILDMSGHLEGYPPMDLLPSQFAEASALAISGFTATHHAVSNVLVSFDATDSKKAHARAKVIGYHCLQTNGALEDVTARGEYDINMEFYEGKWVLRRLAIKRDVPLDRPELYDVAKKRAENGEGRKPRSMPSKK